MQSRPIEKSNRKIGNKLKVEGMEMSNSKVKIYTKAENGKLSKVIEYSTGKKVEIPLDKSGAVKWFDDNKLIKKDTK